MSETRWEIVVVDNPTQEPAAADVGPVGALLAEGWEPFAVSPTGPAGERLWLRRSGVPRDLEAVARQARAEVMQELANRGEFDLLARMV